MTQTKTALILGATGGIGGEVAKLLAQRGWKVRALTRNLEAAKVKEHPNYDWLKGDVMDRAAVIEAARGSSVIFHAVNPPGYRDWDKVVLPMLENTIVAAEESGARVLLPGTFYNYGDASPDLIDEKTLQKPSSRKGEIRKQVEDRLRAMASRNKATALIVRAGDFFGPEPGGNWFSQAMVQPGKPVRFIMLPGKRGVGHSWAYLPDLAEAMVRLLEAESSLQPFEALQFTGHVDSDGTKIVSAIRAFYPNRKIPSLNIPWALVRVAAHFSHMAYEMVDVSYLWRRAYRFDNSRLESLIGPEPRTPLLSAVENVLTKLGC